jgi:tRNA nucleotidyltransferase (CCA-adding enzyme)
MNKNSNILRLASKFESLALDAFASDWWRLSDPEEKDLLNQEYDFGGGLKFRAKDIPELTKQVEVPAGPQEHHPEKNQLLHTNLVFEQAKKLSDDPMVWFSALLHDLGKAYTDKTIWPKQHGHEEIGVPYVERVSNMLGVPENWKHFAMLVAEHHLKCHRAKELTPKSLKKLFESFNSDKELFNSYLTSCEADAKGRMGKHLDPYEQKSYLAQKIDQGFEEKKTAPSTLAISGKDLIEKLGLKPGQELGKILKTIKEMVDSDPMLNDREILLEIARNLLIK